VDTGGRAAGAYGRGRGTKTASAGYRAELIEVMPAIRGTSQRFQVGYNLHENGGDICCFKTIVTEKQHFNIGTYILQRRTVQSSRDRRHPPWSGERLPLTLYKIVSGFIVFTVKSFPSSAMMPSNDRHGIVLTVSQARDIYGLNCMASNMAATPNVLGREVSNSVLLAAHYGVSPKTIRDIWNRKSWVNTTADLFDNLSNLQLLDIKVW
jgi:hypothetical protein